MTDKELQKLGRRELLKLLLEQVLESERLENELEASVNQVRELEETYERLRERLDQKDARINELESELESTAGEMASLRNRFQAVDQLEKDLGERQKQMEGMNETFARLRERLDQKDARISQLESDQEEYKNRIREMNETFARLRERLNQKDAEINQLQETIQAEREHQNATLELSGVFEAAQRAADEYLRGIRAAYLEDAKPEEAKEALSAESSGEVHTEEERDANL